MSDSRTEALSPSWVDEPLGEVCLIVQGQSPPGETYNTEGRGLPFFQGKAEFGEVYPMPVKWCSAPTKTAEQGDVLISIRAPVGPTNLCPSVSCIGRGLAAIRPLGGVPSKYVFYALRSTAEILASKGTGSTFGAIGGSDLRAHRLRLAPLPEQHRIVAEIEKHFTRLEASVAELERARLNLKRYRAAVLKAACEGRLVPTEAELARAEGREYEPADVLLNRILKERRVKWEADQLAKMRAARKEPKDDKWRARYSEPLAPDTNRVPELSKGWVWATVDQVSLQVQYGTSAKTNEDGEGVPVLRMGNIVDGRLETGELKFLPPEHHEFPDLLLSHGDLLFNRTNSAELVGKSAVYKGQPAPCSFASYLIRVRPAAGLAPDFLAYYLNSSHGRAWIRSVVSQQVGQANVNGSKLKALRIPLPPLAEQGRIVAEVERRLSLVDGLEGIVEHSLKRAQRLRQSILKRAFEGKLVPQDPNDESASVLLERIRAERAAQGQARNSRRVRRASGKRTTPKTPAGLTEHQTGVAE